MNWRTLNLKALPKTLLWYALTRVPILFVAIIVMFWILPDGYKHFAPMFVLFSLVIWEVGDGLIQIYSKRNPEEP